MQTVPEWAGLSRSVDNLVTALVLFGNVHEHAAQIANNCVQHLLLLYRRYYGNESTGYDKVWMFNHAEKHFDLDAYLAACP